MSPEETRRMLGDNIRRFRTESHLTQEELGIRLHVSNSYISRLENGTKEPSFHLLEKLSVILNHDISEFLVSQTDKMVLFFIAIKFTFIEYLQGIEYVL